MSDRTVASSLSSYPNPAGPDSQAPSLNPTVFHDCGGAELPRKYLQTAPRGTKDVPPAGGAGSSTRAEFAAPGVPPTRMEAAQASASCSSRMGDNRPSAGP